MRITKPIHIIAVVGFHHEHVDCIIWHMTNSLLTSAIFQLVRILGSHPSDPGSSPGGGISKQNSGDEVDFEFTGGFGSELLHSTHISESSFLARPAILHFSVCCRHRNSRPHFAHRGADGRPHLLGGEARQHVHSARRGGIWLLGGGNGMCDEYAPHTITNTCPPSSVGRAQGS